MRREGGALQTPARRFRQYNVELNKESTTKVRPTASGSPSRNPNPNPNPSPSPNPNQEAHRIWILKPQFGFNQVGMHTYLTLTLTLTLTLPTDR